VFATTFLGHQGWAFQTERAFVLVDPLLHAEFGHAQALDYEVYPPRHLAHAKIPAVSAVILTHEHDDHFDLPSLALIARDVPIYLSSRSSSAARGVLADMGFTVHPLVPGVSIKLEDLELTPFTGDHVTVNCGDEWDALPFLVRHTGGAGSFFTMVDLTLTEQHVAWAAAKSMRPGLVAWTNNALDWTYMTDYLNDRAQGTQQCFVTMGMGHKLIETAWGTPAAMMMCANGFSFRGDSKWLDDRVFCVDMSAVCAQMSNVYKKETFVQARPGQTFVMAAGKLKSTAPCTPWLETAPVANWPSRTKTNANEIRDYAPATKRVRLEPGELAALGALLDGFARDLVGGAVFRGLCSLLATETERAPTFMFALRDGDAEHRFVYDLPGCRFVAADATPRETILAGLACHATDLYAVLRGELGPIALTFGRARLWNALPQRFAFDIFGELARVSHPLRNPAQTARTYARLREGTATIAPVIPRR
jgi:hypothetical protein